MSFDQHSNLYKKFKQHRSTSRTRGIEFLLTFGQWLKIWDESGKLHKRGRCGHEYVMARFGDVGPYAVGNVEIITARENMSQASKGKKRPQKEETKKKISAALMGVKHSEQRKINTSKAHIGLRHSPEVYERAKQTRAKTFSDPAFRKKLSRAIKAAWKRRKAAACLTG